MIINDIPVWHIFYVTHREGLMLIYLAYQMMSLRYDLNSFKDNDGVKLLGKCLIST